MHWIHQKVFKEVWNEIIIILVNLLDQDLVNLGLIRLLILNKYTGVSELT